MTYQRLSGRAMVRQRLLRQFVQLPGGDVLFDLPITARRDSPTHRLAFFTGNFFSVDLCNCALSKR